MTPAPTSTAALPLFVVDVQFGLLVLLALAVGVVSYTVYRDAEARGMDNAAYWGAAVGLLFVLGFVIGGLLAVGAYVAIRPDEAEDPLIPDRFAATEAEAEEPATTTGADLSVSRVQAASDTALRGYARRVDGVDPTTDPADVRAQLLGMVESDGEGKRLAEACDCTPCTCNPCDCAEPVPAETGAHCDLTDDDTADGDTDEADQDGTTDGSGEDTTEDGSFLDAVTEQDLDGTATVETDADRDDLDAVATVSDETDGEDETEADVEDDTDTKNDTDTNSGPDTFDGRDELYDGDPAMPSEDSEDTADGEDER